MHKELSCGTYWQIALQRTRNYDYCTWFLENVSLIIKKEEEKDLFGSFYPFKKVTRSFLLDPKILVLPQ